MHIHTHMLKPKTLSLSLSLSLSMTISLAILAAAVSAQDVGRSATDGPATDGATARMVELDYEAPR